MTIAEITDKIQSGGKDLYYLIASDIYQHSTSFVKPPAAIFRLEHYYNYWEEKNDPLSFTMGKLWKTRVWDGEQLKYIEADCIRISMNNNAISGFNPLAEMKVKDGHLQISNINDPIGEGK